MCNGHPDEHPYATAEHLYRNEEIITMADPLGIPVRLAAEDLLSEHTETRQLPQELRSLDISIFQMFKHVGAMWASRVVRL